MCEGVCVCVRVCVCVAATTYTSSNRCMRYLLKQWPPSKGPLKPPHVHTTLTSLAFSPVVSRDRGQ